MPRKRPFGLGDILLLFLVLSVAAGVRVAYLAAYCDGGAGAGPLAVQETPRDLAELSKNLAEKSTFASRAPLASAEERTAHVAPGYPWMYSLLIRWTPDNVESSARWLNCGLGTLAAAFVFLFARRAFQSRLAATLAGLLAALHPFWIVNVAGINDGTATAFLLMLVVWLGSEAGETGNAFASLLYGLGLAGLALLRAALLPFSFVAVFWLLWRSRHVERGWLSALLAFLGFANGLAPWLVRDFQAFGEPVPIVTSAYLHLWEGNNPKAADLPGDIASLPQPERYRRLASEVHAEIRRDPAQALQRRFHASGGFLLGEGLSHPATPTADGSDASANAPPAWIWEWQATILLGSLSLMLALALVGWRWTWSWRRQAMPSSLALVLIPLPYVLTHSQPLHGPRLPLDGVLLAYAAFVLSCLWPPTANHLLEGPAAEDAKR